MANSLYLSGDAAADALLAENDFALLVGMLLDQQVPMETAFAGPAKLRERLGDLSPEQIAGMDRDELVAVFAEKPAVHRYPKAMAGRVQDLARAIVESYDGNTTALWTEGDPDGKEVLARLKALPGYGQQKAKIFLALLGKQFGLSAPGWREAAAEYGDPDARRSIADVTDGNSLSEVRAFKKEQKAKAKLAT
ncbi:HhH-GPD-type base excision DNA repair protein [Saxibacter everestensis]|uniref:HhH-GPD-type base excision DNA repair protein n=1 Tax=Saxibacter everestensis TaxID=2909229 RepID=A0ABY8QNN6_9MICO|nr:HhH-GPD-type base excision DNA repair protein [Brevibacteriaceae bacterium ZFBP1038]